MTRFWKVALLLVVVVIACFSPEAPKGAGGLAVRILAAGGGGTPLDSGYLIIQGPKDTTVKATPGSAVTVTNLPAGTYTVSLEGFIGGSVAYFGQVTGVSVVAGQTTTATLAVFPALQSTPVPLPAYTTTGQFTFVYSKVALAASYIVQKDTLATFATSHDSAVSPNTDTSVALTIPPTGPWYVRVIAVDPLGKHGTPSARDSITTLTSCCTLTPNGATIPTAGGTQALTATGKDPKGNVLSIASATWASLNTSVATVVSTGVVTGVGTGQATITATVGTLSGAAVITVAPPPTTAVNVWSSMPNTAGSNYIWSVWGTSPTNVFAVGGGATTMRFNGTVWSAMTNPATGDVRSVWGPDSAHVYAVGGNGFILQQSGATSWAAMTSPTTVQLFGLWGSGPTDAFAVGTGGTVVHNNGSTWSLMTQSATTQDLWSVWGASASAVFAVGNNNAVIFYNGSTWTAMTSPAPATTLFYRVWGLAANNVFAVGSGGVIIHYNGTSWTQMVSGTTQLLAGVWGTSATEVYATGGAGTILRFDGTSWSAMSSGQPAGDIWHVWGTSTINLLGVGFPGVSVRGVRGAPFQAFGYPTKFGPAISSFGANFLLGEAVTISSKIELTSISIIDSIPAGNIKIALYTNASGSPGTLVVQSSGAVSSSGTLTYAAPQTQVQPGTYWIMATYDASPSNFVDASGTNTIVYVADTFANALPSTYPASHTTYTANHFNYYVSGYVVP